MADRFSERQRSYVMSRVSSKNTKPEIFIRRSLHRLGYRFRIHVPDLTGRPDVVLPKFRSLIFVNGCFWHRHRGCSKATTPRTNQSFWMDKFERNKRRDRRNYEILRKAGWKVLLVWECELKNEERRQKTMSRLVAELTLRSHTAR